jgi:hypothetical protein
MKTLDEIFDIFGEDDINIDLYHEDEKLCGYELNTYTNGGVNQIIFLDFRDKGNPKNADDFIKSFSDYIDSIDIDDEIELNRQDKSYKANFTLRQSLKDFEGWKKGLEKTLKKIR